MTSEVHGAFTFYPASTTSRCGNCRRSVIWEAQKGNASLYLARRWTRDAGWFYNPRTKKFLCPECVVLLGLEQMRYEKWIARLVRRWGPHWEAKGYERKPKWMVAYEAQQGIAPPPPVNPDVEAHP